MDTIFYTKLETDFKLQETKKFLLTGIKGEAVPTTAPTPWTTDDPDLYEKYDVKTTGTFTNFIQENSSPVVVSSEDLDENFVQIWVKNGVAEKVVKALPQVDMPYLQLSTSLDPSSTNKAETGKAVADYIKTKDVSIQLIGKNKFNLATATSETLVNESGVIVPYSGWSTSEKIYIKPNTYYSYTSSIVSVFDDNNNLLLRQDWNSQNFKSPENASYVIVSIVTNSLSTMQLEEGTSVTSYESYNPIPKVDTSKIIDNSIPLSKLENGFLKGSRISKNLADYRTFENGFYVSETTGLKIPNGDFSISPFIAIKPDTYYIQTNGNRVAFYSSANEASFISGLAAMGDPFKTPLNANFIRVCTPITEKPNYQLEEGTVRTAYEDYLTYKLDKSLVAGLEEIETETETEIPKISKQLKDFAPNFYKKWALRNSDITLVLNGESIATTNYYAEPYTDAKNRPPLMTEKNFTTFIEEALRWEGQKYFRFDNVGIFTEVGTASTKEYDKAWDWTRSVEAELPAVNNRPAITRILEGNNCSVSYVIPTTAKRCDFIFRTDYLNANNAVVAISAGNGKVQVFDENSSSWIEANGYSYSAKEDGVLLPQSHYKSMYQKRLKMRKVNINDSGISVTITNNGSGRLTYWGYQTSPLEYIFDFILSARGGHSISRLENFEAWDTDYYKPDLILWQVPIINEGLDVGNADFSPKTTTKTKEQYAINITDKYADYKSKPYAPDVVSFMLWFGFANNGIDTNNNWVFANDPNGNKVSIPTYIYHSIGAMETLNQNVIDLFSLIHKYSLEDSKNKGSNIVSNILTGSGIMGSTFTIDGVHYNTNGNNVVYKMFGEFFK